MKNFILNKLWIMFLAGFVLGALIFFPTNQIKEKIFANISKSTGAQLQAESMSFGTGLGLGLSKGGVFALKFKKLRVQSGSSIFDCDSATLSPHLWTFFIGRAVVGIACDSEKTGSVTAKASAKPFWGPQTVSIDANFKGFNLGSFGEMMSAYPVKGLLYGDLAIEDMALGSRGVPPMTWKLSLQKVTLPSLATDFVSLPEIQLGTMDTSGALKNGKLTMKPFLMGNASSPLSAELDIDLALDSRMTPQTGEIKGMLRADPAWEQSMKASLDLALLFGAPDANGSRRFRKVVQGGPISLLMNPPLPY